MGKLALIWHGSLQFGACQESLDESTFYPSQVDGWQASLVAIRSHPKARVSINIQGYDLDWIAQYYKKDFFRLLRELIERGQVEYIPGGYSHLFPSFPDKCYRKNIELGIQAAQRHLGLKPDQLRGYALPEALFNKGLIPICRDFGLEYIVFDKASLPPGLDIHDARPLTLQGPGGTEIVGLPFAEDTSPNFIAYFHRLDNAELPTDDAPEGVIDMAQQRITSVYWQELVDRAGQMKAMTIYSDWEGSYCCGHEYKQIDGRWFVYRNYDPTLVERFGRFLARAEEEPAIEFVTCGNMIDALAPTQKVELLDGRGSKDNRFDVKRLAQGSCCDSQHRLWQEHPTMADVQTNHFIFETTASVRRIEALAHIGKSRLSQRHLDDLWKQALVAGCSAWAGSAPDYRHKHQITEPYQHLKAYEQELASGAWDDLHDDDAEGIILFNPHEKELPLHPMSVRLDMRGRRCRGVTLRGFPSVIEHSEHDEEGYLISATLIVLISFTPHECKRVELCLSDTPQPWAWQPVDQATCTVACGTGEVTLSRDMGGSIIEWISPKSGNIVRSLGDVHLRPTLRHTVLHDRVRSELRMRQTDWVIQVQCKAVLGDVPIVKRWSIYPQLSRVDLDSRVLAQHLVSLSVGGIELTPRPGGSPWVFSKLSDPAAVMQTDDRNADLTWHHLGNGLFRYNDEHTSLTCLIDKTTSAAMYNRTVTGGCFIMAQQAGHPEQLIPFRVAAHLKLAFVLDDAIHGLEANHALALAMLVKPLVHQRRLVPSAVQA